MENSSECLAKYWAKGKTTVKVDNALAPRFGSRQREAYVPRRATTSQIGIIKHKARELV
jgi:hypothetical protein